MNQILQLADYLLCKYERKKEAHVLLKQFVEMINNSANSMDLLNDEIAELIVSAEVSLKAIKEIHSNVSENFTLNTLSKNERNKSDIKSKNGTNNFTKSTIPIYPQVYLGKSQVPSEQVI